MTVKVVLRTTRNVLIGLYIPNVAMECLNVRGKELSVPCCEFYDEHIDADVLAIHPWLTEYNHNCKALVELLRTREADSWFSHTIMFLKKLRLYLIENNLPYSLEASEVFLSQYGCTTRVKHERTLLRLNDIYTYGFVLPKNGLHLISAYMQLSSEWKTIIESFLEAKGFTDGHEFLARRKLSGFFLSMQINGAYSPKDLTYNILAKEFIDQGNLSKDSSIQEFSSGCAILKYMASCMMISPGMGVAPKFLKENKIIMLKEFPDDMRLEVERLREESLTFPASEFAEIVPDFLERYKAIGYQNTAQTEAVNVLYAYLVFIEMNGLGYHPGIAMTWLYCAKDKFGWNHPEAKRRVLNLFALYTQEGAVNPERFFRTKSLLCESIPEWCKYQFYAFIELKEKEGLKKSSVSMYRSSITRFCQFLAVIGISRFEDITPPVLKYFNRTDYHATDRGKQAYNFLIKKFLVFLERKQIIPVGVSGALESRAAKSEDIVITLTQNEVQRIEEYVKNASTPIALRDSVILKIGLRMGVRGVDIVNLKLSDINWKNCSIKFSQSKVYHEIELPMPNDVGNVIYRYIKEARPQSDSPYLILGVRAPYKSLSIQACRGALTRALPDRHTPGSGFHVTRKTYATTKLNQNVGKTNLSALLGHQSEASLNPYLNLDENRMKLCPISLAEAGLTLDDDRYG